MNHRRARSRLIVVSGLAAFVTAGWMFVTACGVPDDDVDRAGGDESAPLAKPELPGRGSRALAHPPECWRHVARDVSYSLFGEVERMIPRFPQIPVASESVYLPHV